jgi:hypothetical protein
MKIMAMMITEGKCILFRSLKSTEVRARGFNKFFEVYIVTANCSSFEILRHVFLINKNGQIRGNLLDLSHMYKSLMTLY